ncbi:hypothetical protein T552_02738 [Pneumocystis carinii B80]|uniref:LsmAD domain-containing protein n=1 Tax=Pneumocystis carinii (strain B80) TaxID=1408658 RepID=A0A0W4ZEC8_PNEC8|nr:hypothetical protein T552_02738 [Pneumocystis carinii B80]KTW26733.1 hypothetical protein T552_02738 [Pneumocystis carinii B80]
MSNKQWKRTEAVGKPSPVHKKWTHISPRFSAKIESDASIKHMHDRMLFLIINLAGRIVSVTLRNGICYKGILGTVNTESDMGVVLKMAMVVDGTQFDGTGQTNGVQHRIIDELIILPRDLLGIRVDKVDFNEISQAEQKFQTDAEISGKTEFKERELHKWEPSTNDADEFGPLEELTETVSNGEVWDQFAANERLFGVKSEFDEDLYTTKVDKSHPSYKQREADAARIAQEIQQSSTNNIHIAEERGFIQTDISEEAMYSGVFRPDMHKKDESMETMKKNETEVATPVSLQDFASSEMEKSKIDVPEESFSETSTPLNDKDDNKMSNPDPISSAPKAPKIETELMGTFKQFVSGERKRLQAKKQALFKKEKYVKLQELLKFSQNFKLNTPVPSDIASILAKDKARQNEPTTKSATTSPTITSTPVSQSSGSTKNAQSTSDLLQENSSPINDSQNDKKAPKKMNMKLNVKASVFKPNSMTAPFSQYTQKTEGPLMDVPVFQPLQTTKVSTPDFFNNKKPDCIQRNSILEKFDPFKRYRLEHPDNEHSSEKPYSFLPTWPCGGKSYKEMLQALQQSSNFSLPGQLPYDSNEEYRFPCIDPNSLNFIAMPYGAFPFYTAQQDASYNGPYNSYRNFVPTQLIQPMHFMPGYLVKLLYTAPHALQNMTCHPQYGIYMPQMMNSQNFNMQTNHSTVNYPGPQNSPMIMQFHPGVHGQNNMQQAVMMPTPSIGMNKVIQGQTYGYTG